MTNKTIMTKSSLYILLIFNLIVNYLSSAQTSDDWWIMKDVYTLQTAQSVHPDSVYILAISESDYFSETQVLKFKNIARIDFWGIAFNDTDLDFLSKFKLLESLSIQESNISKIPLVVYKLSKLKYLNLPFNKISSVDSCICNMKGLVSIHLSGNMIKEIPICILELKDSLEYLYLGGNLMNDEYLNWLRIQLPNTRISGGASN